MVAVRAIFLASVLPYLVAGHPARDAGAGHRLQTRNTGAGYRLQTRDGRNCRPRPVASPAASIDESSSAGSPADGTADAAAAATSGVSPSGGTAVPTGNAGDAKAGSGASQDTNSASQDTNSASQDTSGPQNPTNTPQDTNASQSTISAPQDPTAPSPDPGAAQNTNPASTGSPEAAPSTASSAPAPGITPSAVPNTGGSLIAAPGNTCGDNGATPDQPNGSETWINCGIETPSGWDPPMVTIDQLKTVPLDANGIFAPCKDYIDRFNKYAGEFNVPPILVASFALQESDCKPGTKGGGNEAGLMQLGKANCADAPGGNCYDVDYNIRQGVKYFSDTLNKEGGNVFLAIGTYNGWMKGLTVDQAKAAANTAHCRNQNNLDYIYQMVNGWVLGKEGRELGTWHNLDVCNK